MKILMLGWELPPGISGGLGVACYQMCKHLASRGLAIEFVLPYVHTAPQQLSFMKLHAAQNISAEQSRVAGGVYDSYCYNCSVDNCTHAPPGDLRQQQQRYAKFVEALVTDADYDAIHAHDWLTFEAGMQAKKRTGKPLVAHVHSTEFDRSGQFEGNQLAHDIEYECFMMADKIIAVSNLTKDIISQKYNIPADKIEVVHNSIDPVEFGAVDPQNTYAYLTAMQQRGYKIVVSLGRLTVQKGLTFFLKAAQLALSKDPNIIFVVAGSGEQRDELIALSAELGIINNVVFTGFVQGKKWRDLYSIGDIFVMSSVSEPFGLTALEAAGHSTAILLSRQSGVGEVLRGALRFNFWDTERLADYIISVAQHEQLRNTLAANAQAECAKFSWEHVATKCLQLYEKLPAGAAV